MQTSWGNAPGAHGEFQHCGNLERLGSGIEERHLTGILNFFFLHINTDLTLIILAFSSEFAFSKALDPAGNGRALSTGLAKVWSFPSPSALPDLVFGAITWVWFCVPAWQKMTLTSLLELCTQNGLFSSGMEAWEEGTLLRSFSQLQSTKITIFSVYFLIELEK